MWGGFGLIRVKNEDIDLQQANWYAGEHCTSEKIDDEWYYFTYK